MQFTRTVRSSMLYGAECWATMKCKEAKVYVTETHMLRKM